MQARFALATMYDKAASGANRAAATPGSAEVSARIGTQRSALHRHRSRVGGPAQLAVFAADPSQNSAPTIGDLVRKAPVTVQKNTSAAADSAKAMENYKRFLELQRTDPKLRAEAMRRLGDLNQESDQIDNLDKDLSQVDLNSVGGDPPVHAAAEGVSGLRAQ